MDGKHGTEGTPRIEPTGEPDARKAQVRFGERRQNREWVRSRLRTLILPCHPRKTAHPNSPERLGKRPIAPRGPDEPDRRSTD